MRISLKKLTIYPLLLFVTLFLTSCITSSKDQEQRRLALYFLAENVGDEISFDEQTLVIDEFKFALDRINLLAGNNTVLQTSGDVTAIIFSYNKNIVDDRLVLDVDLGIRDIDRFLGYEIFAQPVDNRTGVLDGDFFGQNGNYSVIIKGTVNEIEFNFRSDSIFERNYDFNVDLDGNDETLLIRNIIDMQDVFTSAGGEFLDPTDPLNEEQIINNIRDFLIIQASSATIFEVP